MIPASEQIGREIRNRRERMALHRTEFSLLTGITTETLRSIERGRNYPQIGTLDVIATAIGVTASQLLDPGFYKDSP